jgi:hypothetical protein
VSDLAACYGGEYDESKSIKDYHFLSIFLGFGLCTSSCAGDRQRRADRSTVTAARRVEQGMVGIRTSTRLQEKNAHARSNK